VLFFTTTKVSDYDGFRGSLPQLHHRDQLVLHDVAEHDEQPPGMVLPILPPNTDIIFSAFFDLHTGQDTAIFSLLERKISSKTLPHFLHLNS